MLDISWFALWVTNPGGNPFIVNLRGDKAVVLQIKVAVKEAWANETCIAGSPDTKPCLLLRLLPSYQLENMKFLRKLVVVLVDAEASRHISVVARVPRHGPMVV